MENEWFIPYNVPSLKNSKVKTSKGVFPSKTVKAYLTKLGIQSYNSKKKEVIEYKSKDRINRFRLSIFDLLITQYPAILGFHFVRDSKREFDFGNACQIIHDLLVAHNRLPDDSMNYLIPMPYKRNDNWYTVDKLNPGVYIKYIKDEN